MIAAAAHCRQKKTCPIWASVWACRSPSSNSLDMSSAGRMRIPREFDPDAPAQGHRLSCPIKTIRSTKAAHLRLGAYPCQIQAGTTMMDCYQKEAIQERHRHRYEFNNDYRDALTAAGLVISGTSPDGHIVETIELSRSSLLHRRTVSPGIQEPSQPRPSAVCRTGERGPDTGKGYAEPIVPSCMKQSSCTSCPVFYSASSESMTPCAMASASRWGCDRI